MKIKFLGTAAAEGVPALFCNCPACTHAKKVGGRDVRTRSQALIDESLLIDFPADTYLHIINYGLDLEKITDILITHSHSDHFYIDDILMRLNGFSNFDDSKKLNIYANQAVCKKLNENKYMQKLQSNGIVKVIYIEPFKSLDIGGYKVTSLIADHDSKEDSLIYLIEKQGKALLYAHDTGYFPEKTMKYLERSDIHIDFATFDCCYSLNHYEKGHLGFDEVMVMKQRLCDVGVIDQSTICCVNHFSHNGALSYENMSAHTAKYGFLTSYDTMETEF